MKKEPYLSAKYMMYTQYIEHLPLGTVENVVEVIKNVVRPKRYAVILHDKDIDDDKQPVAPHIHAMLEFDNSHSVGKVARQLNDKAQYIEVWKQSENNGYSYICHRTANAENKHQYEPESVIANFDYPAKLQSISNEVKQKSKGSPVKISLLLDMLYNGTITKAELEAKLTGSQYGRYHRQVEDIYARRLQNEAERFKAKMKSENRQVNVIYIYGQSGTGKTSLAKEYARKQNQDYYISGSSRDLFQDYEGQHTLILDELRPQIIPYQDLLRILDPYSESVNLPSRYRDKALAVDLIIITTPYSPYDFYKKSMTNANNKKTDSFKQLLRRLTLIIHMDKDYINAVEYNYSTNKFENIPNARKKNKFSKRSNKQQTQTNAVDLFNTVVD